MITVRSQFSELLADCRVFLDVEIPNPRGADRVAVWGLLRLGSNSVHYPTFLSDDLTTPLNAVLQ
jgi:hypothetical protein